MTTNLPSVRKDRGKLSCRKSSRGVACTVNGDCAISNMQATSMVGLGISSFEAEINENHLISDTYRV